MQLLERELRLERLVLLLELRVDDGDDWRRRLQGYRRRGGGGFEFGDSSLEQLLLLLLLVARDLCRNYDGILSVRVILIADRKRDTHSGCVPFSRLFSPASRRRSTSARGVL